MFVLLSWLPFASLLMPTGPVLFAQKTVDAPPMVIASLSTDSSTDTSAAVGHFPLTAVRLTHYLALKQDLAAFWQTHQPLLVRARTHEHVHVVVGGVGSMRGIDSIKVFDYVVLTAQDPALAAVFTKNDVLPRQFEPAEDAIYAALLTLIASIHTGTPLTPTDVIQQNAILVQAHRQALAAVGVYEEGPPGED